jgi:hypothetical protein
MAAQLPEQDVNALILEFVQFQYKRSVGGKTMEGCQGKGRAARQGKGGSARAARQGKCGLARERRQGKGKAEKAREEQ